MTYEYLTKSTIYTIKIPSFLVFLTSNFAITHFRRFLLNLFKLNYDCRLEIYLLAKFEALHTNISPNLLYSLYKFHHFWYFLQQILQLLTLDASYGTF